MADDLGWKDLGCYGNSAVDTPVLDRLAREGCLFTDAYSAAPVCTPTRASLMTGEAPARLHITNHAPGHPAGFQREGTDLRTPIWQRYLPLEKVTLAEQLRETGYATGFVGKWHLSHRQKGESIPTELELRPEYQGFDLNIGGCNYGGPPSYFEPFRIPNIPTGEERYLPQRCANECVDFVRDCQQSEKPFFLCWWNYSVHYPFQAPEDLIAKYEARQASLGEDRIKNPVYAAMIEGMDRSIGSLLEELESLDLRRETLVVFTSDNGPFAADVRPLRGEKGYLYEGGIRVPLILRWPGKINSGEVTNTPVVTMDLYETVLDAAGLQPHPSNHQDGLSLLPLVCQRQSLDREAIYFHYPNYAFHKKNRMASAIRKGDFKLLQFYDDGSQELYNLKEDLSEQVNRIDEWPELAKEMSGDLTNWLDQVNAQLPEATE